MLTLPIVRRVVLFAVLLVFRPAAAHALTIIENGDAPPNLENVIDASDPRDTYVIRNSPCLLFIGTCFIGDKPTTVEARSGAIFDSADVLDESRLDIIGGQLGFTAGNVLGPGLRAFDTATIHVRSVVIPVWTDVQSFGSSSILLEDGSFNGLDVQEQSFLSITGGSYNFLFVNDQAEAVLSAFPNLGADSGVFVSGDGTLLFEGGGIDDNGLHITGNGHVTMTGGSVGGLGGFSLGARSVDLDNNATMLLRGGIIRPPIGLMGSSVMTIEGSGFMIDGVPVSLGPVSATAGAITGTLASGDPFDTIFSRQPTATLLLVPEPRLAALLAIAVGALVWTRSRD